MDIRRQNFIRIGVYAILVGAVVFVYLYAKNVSYMAPEDKLQSAENIKPLENSPLTLTDILPAANTWQNAPIVLTGLANETGVILYWKTKGMEAPAGFKVIEGAERSPAYPINNYVDLNDSQARTYVWPVADGQIHYFRICQSLFNGDCGQYSNNLWLRATKN